MWGPHTNTPSSCTLNPFSTTWSHRMKQRRHRPCRCPCCLLLKHAPFQLLLEGVFDNVQSSEFVVECPVEVARCRSYLFILKLKFVRCLSGEKKPSALHGHGPRYHGECAGSGVPVQRSDDCCVCWFCWAPKKLVCFAVRALVLVFTRRCCGRGIEGVSLPGDCVLSGTVEVTRSVPALCGAWRCRVS